MIFYTNKNNYSYIPDNFQRDIYIISQIFDLLLVLCYSFFHNVEY